MRKVIAVFSYLILICLAFGFRVSELLDVRQLLLVLAGTAIFYFITSGLHRGARIDWNIVGKSALLTGLLQMFALIALYLPRQSSDTNLLWAVVLCSMQSVSGVSPRYCQRKCRNVS